jgi:uncharacterized protein (TIGR02147 family)
MTSVLDYDNYRNFLKDVLQEKIRKNPTYSLRAFARQLAMSPSHLSRALSGRKRLSVQSARLVSQSLAHSPEEAEHFLALVEIEGARSDEAKKKIIGRLAKDKRAGSRVVALETFRAISGWHHFAILSLTTTRGFRADASWIAKRLGIKPLEARLAVDRLIALGLLEKTPKGWRAVNDANIETADDVGSAAIRENHRQHLELAAKALEEVPVELREFQNLSLSMNLSEMPKAKKMIRAFVKRLNHELETNPGQEIFQMNLQFYLLSKSEKGRA